MLSGTGADTPLVTLVVPVFDVALYVGAFLDSLDAQALGPADLADVQVVAVDDGSTDASGELLEAWAAASPLDVTVVHQENRGLSGARNTGLELARGAWVSFPDPDDVLGPGYLAAVLARLRTLDDDVALLATRILVLDAAGALSDTHRLRGRFANGSRVVDLDVEPDLVHLQAASGFYRLDVLRGAGLRFEADVRPNFEDAFLTAHHLAAAPAPKVALLAEAHYRYRRRADGSSLVQQSYRRGEKYTVLPRLGYLRLLQQFAARGPVPPWVQNLVLYDLLFYFREDQRENAATGDLPAALSDAFHASVAEILALVDADVLAGFAVIPTSPTLREALRIGYVDRDAGACQVHLARVDTDQQLVQLRYLHGTVAPREELVVGGQVVAPVHAKTRDLRWFGRTLARERIAWVPATAPLELRLDGRRVPLPLGEPDTRLRVEPAQLWRDLARRDAPVAGPRRPAPAVSAPAPAPPAPSAAASAAAAAPTPGRTRSRAAALWQRARPGREAVAPVQPPPQGRPAGEQRPAAERFAGAWAFTDDDQAAGDNAEHLCRWVREHRPEVNAWFVLSRASADWDRLEAEGFALVDPASPDLARLVRSTEHRIASRVDEQVVSPLAGQGRARGRFTYLPRRPLLTDESRTLDGRRVSLVVTTTTPEHAAVVGDATPYLFTTKEVELAGMPRHDRLLALAATGARPDLLLLAPAAGPAPAPAEPGPWVELLASPQVRAWAAARGLRLAVLATGGLGVVGEGAEVLDPEVVDVQEVLAATAVLVTGSATLATEAALLRRPVVHLQVEALPAHGTPRAGWFRWEEHAFGPVCGGAAEVAEQLEVLGEGERGPAPADPWAERMERAFPYRDGRSCERVHRRIAGLVEPAPEALERAQTWVPTVLPGEDLTGSPASSPARRPTTADEEVTA